MAKRIIAIAGATGNQGGSVLKALAGSPHYEVRALTRNPSKPASKELLQYGSNIVLQECDLTSKSSLETALKGVYGFFAFTNYFAHRIEKVEDIKEEEEGKLLADVAKAVGIKHYIWSTLPEIKEYSGGKYQHVHHFDGKYRIEQYVRSLGFEIVSCVAPSCYLQNFTGPVARVDSDGTVVFALPLPSQDSTVPICDIEHDMGVVVKAVLDLGPQANGKLFPIVSQFIECKQVASDFEKVTGRKARFELIPRDVYIKGTSQYLGDLVALDLWEMFNAFADVGFAAAGEPENLQNTKELNVHLNTWVDYLKASGWKGPH